MITELNSIEVSADDLLREDTDERAEIARV